MLQPVRPMQGCPHPGPPGSSLLLRPAAVLLVFEVTVSVLKFPITLLEFLDGEALLLTPEASLPPADWILSLDIVFGGSATIVACSFNLLMSLA